MIRSCGDSPKEAGQTVNFEDENFGDDLDENEVEEIEKDTFNDCSRKKIIGVRQNFYILAQNGEHRVLR